MSTTVTWPATITVAGHPPSANELRRLHPLARYRRCKPFKECVAWQCKALHLPAPLQRARVVATLTYTRRLFRDVDGAVASLKPCLDGLVVGGRAECHSDLSDHACGPYAQEEMVCECLERQCPAWKRYADWVSEVVAEWDLVADEV